MSGKHSSRQVVNSGLALAKRRQKGTSDSSFAAPAEAEGGNGQIAQEMTVDEKFQGKKIGRALAEAAIARAKKRGAQNFSVFEYDTGAGDQPLYEPWIQGGSRRRSL